MTAPSLLKATPATKNTAKAIARIMSRNRFSRSSLAMNLRSAGVWYGIDISRPLFSSARCSQDGR